VQALHATGMPLFGLTNWSSETVHHAIAKISDITDCLNEIIVSGYAGLMKPDPAIYEWAIQFFGVNPASTLFIDDNQSFVDGAKAVGLQGEVFAGAEALSARLHELGVDF